MVARGIYNNEDSMPVFEEFSILSSESRWRYGMKLGKKLSLTDTGYDEKSHQMPKPPDGYLNGDELRKVDTRPSLHMLDALLMSATLVDDHPIIELLLKLTPYEQGVVLKDQSPDGLSYSKALSKRLAVTAEILTTALKDGDNASALLPLFLEHWRDHPPLISPF